MSKSKLENPIFLLLSVSAMTAVFCAGIGTGFYFYPLAYTVEHAEDDHESEPAQEEDDHVALTRQAYDNLGLKLGKLSHGDYWRTILIPGEVVEIPGRSDLSISAPVTGIVEEINVLQGETLSATKPLFVLRITDEALTDAQSQLLGTLARKDVLEQEILRLAPLTRSGAVAGSRKRDLEYELQQLQVTEQTLVQEIRGRGLPDAVLESVLEHRSLAATLKVQTPAFVQASFADKASADPSVKRAAYVSSRIGQEKWEEVDLADDLTLGYSVETLHVHPGKTVQRGDDLCGLAYHSQLYVRGTAFDSDIEALNRIIENQWAVTAVSQHPHGSQNHETVRSELQLQRIDNHVDPETQTVRFYSLLPNEVDRSLTDDAGRLFQQWRFRPGQRVHLQLPVEKWTDQLTLPAEAVVVEGPNAIVFVEHHEPHVHEASSGAHAHEEDSIFIELEPLPVRLLHRDEQTAVIADDGQLQPEHNLALNNAWKLYLAMQLQASGGGGHHHEH